MCFDFRRARSHPLGPTLTSRLPGRFAMYTSKEVHVKVRTFPFMDAHPFNINSWPHATRYNQRLVDDKLSKPRGTT